MTAKKTKGSKEEEDIEAEKVAEKLGVPIDEKRIVRAIIEDEMKASYLDYAMSVIVGRALPDIRDGLKPVHRRILYAMNDLGIKYATPFKKCARIVGEVLGKYHPHGDSAVYDALVRMAQNFSLRYPLVQGQGNFGSVDGDNAAAMRYCITGDSLILTDKGILPIRDVSIQKEAKIKMKILSYNGKKNSATKFFNSEKHKIIKIETELGYKIKGSYNHPLLCWTAKNKFPQVEWKLLENIDKGDVIILNRNNSLFAKNNLNLNKFIPKSNSKIKKIKLPSKMNKDLAFLLGALVSEGSFHQHKVIFNNSDIEFYNHVKNIIFDQFKGTNVYERKISGNCLELDLYHKHVVGFLINIGLKEVRSDKKEIPFSVLQSSKKVIASFLKGLFEGDGSALFKVDKRHNGKSIELTYNSKSSILIKQLKTVLLNLGIVTTKPYVDKRNGCYKLIISGYESIKQFKEEIGFFSDKKQSALKRISSMNPNRMSKTDYIPFLNTYLRGKYKKSFISRNNFDRYNNLKKNYNKLIRIIDWNDKKLVDFILNNNYLFNKVAKKSKLSKKEEVFSVKVDSKCHSFVANGFINHNTEARLAKISEEMLSDIEKDTVEFQDNFDGSLKEPMVLPSRIPNLLINGSSGIAVGMATNIPPHNIKEICNAVIELIDKPDIEIQDIIKTIQGPDFPTGGIIIGKRGIVQTYSSGRGIMKVRGRIEEEEKKDRQRLIITEIPYQLNKSQLIEQIADSVNDKTIHGISDLRDESDRKGMRIVIELRKGANPEIIKNQLYKHTRLQASFGAIMLGLDNGKPKTLNIKQLLESFLIHRRVVVRRRTSFDLKKSEDRAHILKGLLIALEHLDPVIKLIKTSKNPIVAKKNLITVYKLTDKQSQAILDMKLQRLTGLEQQKIKDEHKDLIEVIRKLKEILADEIKIFDIIKQEMKEVIEKYGDERRTSIQEDGEEELDMEDLIKPEENVITISHAGYVKRQPIDMYKTQRRGGRGVIGATTKEEDFIKDLFVANTHSYLLVFTDKGKVYWLKVYNIPEATRVSKGKPIVNLIKTEPDEKIQGMIPIREFDDKHYLLFATKSGIVKKTKLNAYSRPRQGGIIAINLNEGDEVVEVIHTDGHQKILIASSRGQAVKFFEADARPVGRNSYGVRGIRLGKDDFVVGMIIARDDKTVLTITENGYGKRTSIDEYRLISRGGKGVRNIICSPRNGCVSNIRAVNDNDEIMVVSEKGILIRIPVKNISVIGRNTQGVRIMRIGEGDKVVSVAKIETNGNNNGSSNENVVEELKEEAPKTPEEEEENTDS